MENRSRRMIGGGRRPGAREVEGWYVVVDETLRHVETRSVVVWMVMTLDRNISCRYPRFGVFMDVILRIVLVSCRCRPSWQKRETAQVRFHSRTRSHLGNLLRMSSPSPHRGILLHLLTWYPATPTAVARSSAWCSTSGLMTTRGWGSMAMHTGPSRLTGSTWEMQTLTPN